MTKLPYHKLINYIFSIATALLLISCGGGGGGGGVSTSSSYVTTEYNNQYGLGKIKASAAYDRGYNGDGTKVAVFDGGFDTSHTDLDANFITGYDTEDSNNTPNADTHTSAMGGHGTHVAGIIAAEKNDSGIHGVAYNASIIPVKVFKDSGAAVSGINLGIDYATDNGAIALNNSWGTSRSVSATCGGVNCYLVVPAESSTGSFTSAERTSWAGVATDNNVVVFAAGNEGMNSTNGQVKAYRSSNDAYLTSYDAQVVVDALAAVSYVNRSSPEARYGVNASAVEDNWLNVVAVDSSNTIATFSNGCGDTKAYCIAAPGVDINSTLPTDLDSDGFGTKSGTSMAAPHVAAAVAVLKHEYPNLTGAEIVDLLLSNATDLGASGTDDVYGVGLLNLDAATAPSGTMVLAQTSQNNSLERKSLSNSSINFNSLFNSKSISSNNFLGVVDDYNRVYSLKLNDFVSYQSSKSLVDQLLIEKRSKKTNITTIDKFNSVNYTQNDNEGLINFDNLNYANYEIPYIKIFEKNQGSINYKNNKIKSNFVVFDEEVSNDNFILYTNFQNKINKTNSSLNLGIINEGETFLGASGNGLFSAKSNTIFIHNNSNVKLNSNNEFVFNFTAGQTFVDFEHDVYLKDTTITTNEYMLGLVSEHKNYKIKNFFGINHPLSIVDGSLELNTISGYDQNGDYRNRKQEIDLSSSNNLNIMWNVDKFFNNNSLFSLKTLLNEQSSNLTGLYVVKF